MLVASSSRAIQHTMASQMSNASTAQVCSSQHKLRARSTAFCSATRRPSRCNRQHLVCQAQKEASLLQNLGRNVAAVSAAALLSFGGISGPAVATEFDVINTSTPSLNYLIDDANVLNKTTKKAVNDRLYKLETETGYRVEVVTVRKLEFETDSFAFGDKILARWYPDKSEADKKGILIVVTTAKDGAIIGGPSFMQKIGDTMVDSVLSENIPVLTEQEKFNETITSSIKRLESSITGSKDPGAPQRAAEGKTRTYKTKQETDKSRNTFATIVLVLLGISVLVPMLQYWGYTSKE